MNAFVLLMALLGLSYFSGLFGRGRGRALPSNSLWVVLGFLFGPGVLGLIDRSVETDVEPIAYVAMGWVALVAGLDYGVARSRRLRSRRVIAGVLLGLVTTAILAGAAWWLAPWSGLSLGPIDRWLLALGLASVASETTSRAVHWVAERQGTTGPLAQLLDDLAETKDVVPIVAAGVALCLHPRFEVAHRLPLPSLTLPATVVGVALMIGAAAAAMLAREKRIEQSWGILVGTTLLAVGTAARLGLPVVTALFALGLIIGVGSRQRDRLFTMVDPTKHGALLPALLLAGARIEPRLVLEHGLVAVAVLALRAALLWIIGYAVTPRGPGRAAASWVGPAMLPAGELTMPIGLTFAITFAGPIGDTVLVTAAVVTLVGELVGALALRSALRATGELTASSAAPAVEEASS